MEGTGPKTGRETGVRSGSDSRTGPRPGPTSVRRPARYTAVWLLALAASLIPARAQEPGGAYSYRMGFGAFTEYSNDSSHMLLGYADGRSLAAVGFSYEFRTFLGAHFAGSALAELTPLMGMSDPTMRGVTFNFPSQPAFSGTLRFSSQIPVVTPVTAAPENAYLMVGNGMVYPGTASYIAGRRWTYLSDISPLGYKLNALPGRRLQPYLTGLGGFAFATRDVPVFNSSAFNFTLQAGVGMEWFRRNHRSIGLEYRYHHLSNRGIGAEDPGVDSGVFKATYTFGR